MFIVLHTCCGSGYKIQLWSTTTWFQSDASSTLRLEEERGSRHSKKCFPPASIFTMSLKYQPIENQMFTVSQATKKGKHPGSRIWTLVGLQQIKISSRKCWFLLKIWSKRRMPVHYIVFPAPQSIVSSQWSLLPTERPSSCFKRMRCQ